MPPGRAPGRRGWNANCKQEGSHTILADVANELTRWVFAVGELYPVFEDTIGMLSMLSMLSMPSMRPDAGLGTATITRC